MWDPPQEEKTCSGAASFCSITSSWRFPWPEDWRSLHRLHWKTTELSLRNLYQSEHFLRESNIEMRFIHESWLWDCELNLVNVGTSGFLNKIVTSAIILLRVRKLRFEAFTAIYEYTLNPSWCRPLSFIRVAWGTRGSAGRFMAL
jgi:hypothetical protein